jgi:hypothetical protein
MSQRKRARYVGLHRTYTDQDLLTWRALGAVTVVLTDPTEPDRPHYLELSPADLVELRDQLQRWIDHPTEGLPYRRQVIA